MPVNKKTMTLIYEKMYPIGTYYFSNEPTNPQSVFGGNWEAITDTFVKAMNTSIGQTGGNRAHTVSNFCPAHTHNVSSHTHSINSHAHSGSLQHKHNIGSHTHNVNSFTHTHQYKKWNAPSGKVVQFAERSNGVGIPGPLDGTSTMSILGPLDLGPSSLSGTTSYSWGSTDTDSASLGSVQRATTGTLQSISLTTDNTGASSSSSIDIMPPYKKCYCWRRTG